MDNRVLSLIALVALTGFYTSASAQEAKVCTITRDAPIISRSIGEYKALIQAGMKEEADKELACTAAKGSKVVVRNFGETESGAGDVSAHIVSGPQKECVGRLLPDYYTCPE